MTPGNLGNMSGLRGSLQWEQNATPSAAADVLTYTLTETNLCFQMEMLDCELPWVCICILTTVSKQSKCSEIRI